MKKYWGNARLEGVSNRSKQQENEINVYTYVTGDWLKSLNGTLFSHVWRRGGLALDPLQK